jgi:hypothetical protein
LDFRPVGEDADELAGAEDPHLPEPPAPTPDTGLAEQIRQVHADFDGTYGVPWITAELPRPRVNGSTTSACRASVITVAIPLISIEKAPCARFDGRADQS